MKRSVALWEFVGFAAVSLLGTLLHFLYEWTGESILAAPISGVNESTWEHMKLLYFPLLLFSIFQSFFFKETKNYWCIKLCGTLIGILLIPILFYTINGAFGKTPDFVNITIFFVSALGAFFSETLMFKSERIKCSSPGAAFFCILLIGVLFIVFTFFTPTIPLFKDPLTGKFGISS